MDCTVHGILQVRTPEWVAVPFSRGILPIQGSNPGLLHCRQILYQLIHQGSPRVLEWVAYPFSRGSSWTRNQTGVSCIAGIFFTNWATREIMPRKFLRKNTNNLRIASHCLSTYSVLLFFIALTTTWNSIVYINLLICLLVRNVRSMKAGIFSFIHCCISSDKDLALD